MGLFDRISRVVRANLNDLVSQAEDPEKVLEQAVIDMQEDRVKLRQAVANIIAEQKRTEQRYKNDLAEANKWQERAALALNKGDENLAREALTRKKPLTDSSAAYKAQLDQLNVQVEGLKRNLMALEGKISEAQTKKNMLQARAKSAKASEALHQTLSSIDTNSAMGAFERMENKVLNMEARSQAIGELSSVGLEQQFASLESGSDVEDELAALKASINPPQLEAAKPAANTPKDEVVDAELEDLRRKLNSL